MTIINNSDDLLRLLRDDHHFYEEARRLILTGKLIDLPEQFVALSSRLDRFIADQEKFNEEQRQFNEEQRRFNAKISEDVAELRQFAEEQKQFNEEQRRFNAKISEDVAELRQFAEEQKQFNEEQRQFNARISEDVAELRQFAEEQRRFNQRISQDIGELKGNSALRMARFHSIDIAEYLGYTWQADLSRGELRGIVGLRPQSGLEPGEWISFTNADLTIRALDADGDIHYLSVEASYTADERDTDRALRNARIIQERTGKPSHAVIASVRNDDSIAPAIESDAVLWYQLDAGLFAPE